MKHVRLPAYDAADLDDLSYTNGELVNDTTNALVRYMDGETPGGFKLATQDYVQTNAITSVNLATNLTSALAPYAKTVDLAPFARTTDVNSAISAIPIYSLPTASASVLGGVKVDGTSITINNGVISGSNQYTLPIATASILGGVKPDGTTITINPTTGVISGANTYVLPTATTSVKGGVTIPAVGTSGINNTSGALSLATASTTQLGGVKVDGSTITINGSGVISGAQLYTLPTATTTVLGGVTVPAVANSGLTNTAGAIRLATATTNQLGGVKVDGVTITINGSGVIAANITGAIVFQGGWNAATNTPTLNNVSSAYNTNGFEFVTTTSGTVNFGAGNVSFAVGDNVIYDGTKWVKIPIGSSAGQTNNILTFDSTGGAVAGSTFNGSAILTVSYATVGASPLAGSSNITTVGTIGTGTWNGSVISSTYGGTGVNNAGRTLTISGSNRTLDQDVSSGSSPTFTGTNFSGTAASLVAGNATLAANATSAGKATNIAGGANLRLAYNTAADTTAFIAAPTIDSTYLKYTTGGLISWGTVSLSTAATNVAGGAANRIVYNTAADTTAFIAAPSSAGTYLTWNGTAFAFSAVSGATGGTVTSVGGSGSVNGITLTGTVTTTGNLALGGTLTLATAPAIGSSSANTGAFTTLSASTSVSFSPSGTITLNPSTAGTINNMSIGATTASTGRFTTLTATTSATLSPSGTVTINPTTTSSVDNVNIGANTAGTGVFTTLTSTDNRDTIYASGSTTGTITPNAANGNVQTITLTGSITLNALASPVSGQSLTLIVKQPASGGPFTLTSSMLFAGGFKTLSTANNAIDMITVSYIGTTYYASLVTGFA
jgi:hypothetical protein